MLRCRTLVIFINPKLKMTFHQAATHKIARCVEEILALAHYSKADSSIIEEIQQSILVVRDHLDLMVTIFHKFNSRPYFTGQPIEQLNCLNRAAEYAQLT